MVVNLRILVTRYTNEGAVSTTFEPTRYFQGYVRNIESWDARVEGITQTIHTHIVS
jgi:hypothetical protein